VSVPGQLPSPYAFDDALGTYGTYEADEFVDDLVDDAASGGVDRPAPTRALAGPPVPRQRHRRSAERARDTAVGEAWAEQVLRRGVGVVGLLGIALIHVLDLPGKLEETPYLAVGYVALILGCLGVAEWLVRRSSRGAWLAAGSLAATTLVGFVVNRTVGMPGAMDDIGNWLEPLGLASMAVEGTVLVLAAIALVRPAPQP